MSLKKIIYILLLSSFYFVSTPTNIFGQTPPKKENQFLKLQEAAKPGKTTLEKWTDDSITSSAMAINRSLMGEVPSDFFDQLDKVLTNGTGKFPKLAIGGAIGQGSQMISTLFTPPASGIQYIASLKDEMLGKPVYAQGFGFKGLEFLLPLWKGARNIVYVLSSIIFVVIGLMIILRVKISPQAVVTVQSAIPQVITTLILVTFSYAIAGLMIDAGNIIAAIVIAILYNAKGVNLDKSLFDTWSPSSGFFLTSDAGQLVGNFFSWIADFANKAPLRFTNLVNPDINTLNLLAFRTAPNWFSLMLLSGLLGSVMTGIFISSLGNALLGSAGGAVGSFAGMIVGGLGGGILGGLLIPIILSVLIGIWLIKLYFGLIKVYVTLIFKIIVGPLEIAMGAFPNAKIGFNTWLLDVFTNIMVFPIVTIVFIIINILTDTISGSVGGVNPTGNAWAPGLINSGDLLFRPILSACVGMAGLAMISKLPDLIPQYIFMIKPSEFSKAIGQNMDDATKFSKAVVGQTVHDRLADPAASAAANTSARIMELLNWARGH